MPITKSIPYSPLAVVGTVAIDAVETPHGKRDKVFGGSASYFSYIASFFTPVSLVAVVGDDFPDEYRRILAERPIDLSHLHVTTGKTFFWRGKYGTDLNSAQTLETQLNSLLHFDPKLCFRKHPRVVFLANIDPALQEKVLNQLDGSKLDYVASDTMNFWIQSKSSELKKVLKRVDCIILNDGESKLLTQENNLIKAAKCVSKMGPRHVIIKKGEHGSLLYHEGKIFVLPAYPVEQVFDPTGAGDTFAGGFMGYLALTNDLSFTNMKKALAVGTVTASFTVQDFGLEALRKITRRDVLRRLAEFKKLCIF